MAKVNIQEILARPDRAMPARCRIALFGAQQSVRFGAMARAYRILRPIIECPWGLSADCRAPCRLILGELVARIQKRRRADKRMPTLRPPA